jgi:Na+-exporting ATPase
MVVKKAWIPAKGTYSIGPSHDPYDPTTGDISHSPSSPSSDSDPQTEAAQPPSSTMSGPQNSEKQGAVSVESFLSNNPYLEDFLNVASMANLAHVYQGDDSSWYARGDPTEIAIQVFASRFGWNRMTWTTGDCPTWLQIAEFPFDSNIKMMSVIYSKLVSTTETAEMGLKHHKVFTKGAVERVIESCTAMVCEEGGSRIQITEEWKREIMRNTEALASRGHRVLALADREWHSPQENYPEKMRPEIESDLNFLGLISLYDPPRPESPNAVIKCHRAGISVHMLTGDHRSTAETIAREVGILPSITELQLVSAEVKNSLVMTAKEFDLLSDEELDFLPALPLVIARCTPSTKVRMIDALHRRECFDAMTGDGVNDAPSLKRADIGIAMGSGSDVAKDASDIVLTDNNFASILAAIEEGRRMFDNVQKFVLHLLAENIAQASTLLVGLAFKDSTGISVFPLAPVEILWVIMITSGMPDMGLGMEMAAPDIMERKPQDVSAASIDDPLLIATSIPS